MAAHVQEPARCDVSGSRRARRFRSPACHYRATIEMARRSGQVAGEGADRRLIMDPKDLKSKLAAAEKHPQQIALAVAGLSDHVLKFRDNPKKWCIQEILAHLADME